ncbi:hypothetical protein QEJ31_02580 [Pigmentibacter sp. JX0631]|uniref:hypothetical protein n=1 Tax=Pigmentibacter sp. JX0631 TaxID=2976982 RepID=UPI00246890D0|nr:hypothetical protein [Pigmentibacter sp. JX0631]WGL60487.1 hypothetical protein QEJ31_02580 [Pigmentibacter sp. JX0631]
MGNYVISFLKKIFFISLFFSIDAFAILNLSNESNKIDNSYIGYGINTIKNELKNNCLKNSTFVFHEVKSSYIKYFHNISANDFSEIYNFTVNNSGNFKVVKLKNIDEFEKSLTNDAKTINTSLISKITFGNYILNSESIEKIYYLNDNATHLAASNINMFYDECGNEIIENQELSSLLFINASLSFSTKEEKLKFEQAFTGNFNIFDLKENFIFFENLKKYNFSIKLTGAQFGGHPKNLQKILKSKPCNKNSIKNCLDIFENIYQYFSQDYVNQLEEQSIENYVTTSIKTIPYSSITILDSNNNLINNSFKISNSIFSFFKKLEDEKNQNKNILNRTEFIINHKNYDYLSKNDKVYIEYMRDKSLNNIKFIENISANCEKNESYYECIDEIRKKKDSDQEVSNLALNFQAENYNIFTDVYEFKLEPIVTLINGTKHSISTVNLNYIINKPVKYVFLDDNGYEVSSDFIRVHCLKNYAKRYNLQPWDIIFPIKGLVKSIKKAIMNKEFALLDVIYNKKTSLINSAPTLCGDNTEFFLSLNEGSKIKKIIVWKDKYHEN